MNKILNIRSIRIFLFALILVVGSNSLSSQVLTFQSTERSKVIIEGTSSLHDWQMESSLDNCKLRIKDLPSDGTLELVEVEFSLPVTQLKSEHKNMDANAHKALKVKDFPNIRFEINRHQEMVIDVAGKKNEIVGILEIAGVKKEVVLEVIGRLNSASQLVFEFSTPIQMEDFNVKPPSFMFGAVTTGSSVLASFEMYFNNLNQ